MNVNKTIQDFFEEKGYKCCICEEPYDVAKRERQPTLLSCKQHSICIGCIEENGKALKTCPECRLPLIHSVGPVTPNSQIIRAMDTMTEMWKQLHGQAAAAPAAAPGAAPAPAVMPIAQPPKQCAVPQGFKNHLFCESVWNLREQCINIEDSFPDVIPVMKWEGNSKELLTDFDQNSSQWMALVNQANREIRATAWFKCVRDPGHAEAHWMGVTHDDKGDYLELYKSLVDFVEGKAKGISEDWKNYSLTSFFNYDNEEAWLNTTIDMIRAHNRRFEVQYIHKQWGSQAKLTVYPCRKAGHVQNIFKKNGQFILQRNMNVKELVQPLVNECLEKLQLKMAFSSWAAENNLRDALQASKALQLSFTDAPETFYIYSINESAKGFIEFKRTPDRKGVNVMQCGMLSEYRKYAEHFIRQFIETVKTQPTLEKGVKARHVNFTCYGNLPRYLRDAIDASEPLLREFDEHQ